MFLIKLSPANCDIAPFVWPCNNLPFAIAFSCCFFLFFLCMCCFLCFVCRLRLLDDYRLCSTMLGYDWLLTWDSDIMDRLGAICYCFFRVASLSCVVFICLARPAALLLWHRYLPRNMQYAWNILCHCWDASLFFFVPPFYSTSGALSFFSLYVLLPLLCLPLAFTWWLQTMLDYAWLRLITYLRLGHNG